MMMPGCLFDEDDGEDENGENGKNYKQEMRIFVQGISAYAKGIKSGFIIIPQNGHELLTADGEEGGSPAADYIDAVDGVGGGANL